VPGRATSKAPGGKADIDWDDDDEATQIFDRGHEDASRSLLHSAPPGAPPPLPAAGAPPPSKPLPAPGMPPASRAPTVLTRPGASRGPLPPPPVTAPAAPAPTPPPSIPDAAMVSMMQPQSRSGVWAVLFAVVVIGAAAAGAYLFFMPKKGTIVVTVAGPGNKPVDAVEVWVDATKVCDKSPCRTPELAGGTHLVKVTAAGYQPTADQAVKVVPGDEAVHNVTLQRGSGGTGLKVTAEGRGLRLSVDGKEIGPLPQELRDLSPGEHTVQIQGGDRYESYEETVTVEADKMLPIEPKLKVKKGLATIKLGDNADGAKVLLVTGNERRPLPALPITVDIPTEKPYQIVAEKKGLQPFVQKIAFEDGAAEKTFTIDMAPFGPAITPDPDPAPAPKSGGGRAPAVARTTTKSSTQATGNGTININSIPASNVILDGRPLGSTPKAGISVSPGAHTVIFIHPEHGRKAKTVNVEAGKAVSAAVKFP
jgi:serine/threonine-protein kinase